MEFESTLTASNVSCEWRQATDARRSPFTAPGLKREMVALSLQRSSQEVEDARDRNWAQTVLPSLPLPELGSLRMQDTDGDDLEDDCQLLETQLKSIFCTLVRKRRLVQQRRATNAAVRRVPHEVLQRILSFVVPQDLPRRRNNAVGTLTSLMLVSRQWNIAVRDTPELWSNLNLISLAPLFGVTAAWNKLLADLIARPNITNLQINVFHEHLDRSGAGGRGRLFKPHLSFILPILPRIGTLSIGVPPDAIRPCPLHNSHSEAESEYEMLSPGLLSEASNLHTIQLYVDARTHHSDPQGLASFFKALVPPKILPAILPVLTDFLVHYNADPTPRDLPDEYASALASCLRHIPKLERLRQVGVTLRCSDIATINAAIPNIRCLELVLVKGTKGPEERTVLNPPSQEQAGPFNPHHPNPQVYHFNQGNPAHIGHLNEYDFLTPAALQHLQWAQTQLGQDEDDPEPIRWGDDDDDGDDFRPDVPIQAPRLTIQRQVIYHGGSGGPRGDPYGGHSGPPQSFTPQTPVLQGLEKLSLLVADFSWTRLPPTFFTGLTRLTSLTLGANTLEENLTDQPLNGQEYFLTPRFPELKSLAILAIHSGPTCKEMTQRWLLAMPTVCYLTIKASYALQPYCIALMTLLNVPSESSVTLFPKLELLTFLPLGRFDYPDCQWRLARKPWRTYCKEFVNQLLEFTKVRFAGETSRKGKGRAVESVFAKTCEVSLHRSVAVSISTAVDDYEPVVQYMDHMQLVGAADELPIEEARQTWHS